MQKKTQMKSQKYKIVIELKFGPYNTSDDAAAVKKHVKSKAPKIVFGAVTKSRNGHCFNGKLTTVKSVAAPAAYVKRAISERAPGAKVTVTKV